MIQIGKVDDWRPPNAGRRVLVQLQPHVVFAVQIAFRAQATIGPCLPAIQTLAAAVGVVATRFRTSRIVLFERDPKLAGAL